MHYKAPKQVLVKATGKTTSTFTHVNYSVKASQMGATGPQAKERLKPIIDKIKQVLAYRARTATLDMEHLKTSLEISPVQEHRGGLYVLIGYQANYSLQFSGKGIMESLIVHDDLTSIPDVAAATPVFFVDNMGEVAERAFEDAATKAQRKFEGQCKALKIDPNDYHIISWSLEDEHPKGKSLSFKENGVSSTVNVEVGEAVHEIRAEFIYAYKLDNSSSE